MPFSITLGRQLTPLLPQFCRAENIGSPEVVLICPTEQSSDLLRGTVITLPHQPEFICPTAQVWLFVVTSNRKPPAEPLLWPFRGLPVHPISFRPGTEWQHQVLQQEVKTFGSPSSSCGAFRNEEIFISLFISLSFFLLWSLNSGNLSPDLGFFSLDLGNLSPDLGIRFLGFFPLADVKVYGYFLVMAILFPSKNLSIDKPVDKL